MPSPETPETPDTPAAPHCEYLLGRFADQARDPCNPAAHHVLATIMSCLLNLRRTEPLTPMTPDELATLLDKFAAAARSPAGDNDATSAMIHMFTRVMANTSIFTPMLWLNVPAAPPPAAHTHVTLEFRAPSPEPEPASTSWGDDPTPVSSPTNAWDQGKPRLIADSPKKRNDRRPPARHIPTHFWPHASDEKFQNIIKFLSKLKGDTASKLLKKIKHLHQQFQHSARAPEQRTKTLATLRAIIEGMEDAGIKLPHN